MNASELKAKLAEIFTCVDGPPRAYFELPTAVFQPSVQTRVAMGAVYRAWVDQPPPLRIVYNTINPCIIGEPDEVESMLCNWVWIKLSGLLTYELKEDRDTVLFWRKHPSLSGFTDEKGRTASELYMRLAIPGFDLSAISKPEGERGLWL